MKLNQSDLDGIEKAMTSEYKLAQDKMDKIGEFKFRALGWASSLVTAVIIGIGFDKLPFAAVILILVGVFIFNVIDFQQRMIQKGLGVRVHKLESAMHAIKQFTLDPNRRNQAYLNRSLSIAGITNQLSTAFKGDPGKSDLVAAWKLLNTKISKIPLFYLTVYIYCSIAIGYMIGMFSFSLVQL